MALQWKKNSRYPSVTRPGVFPRIQEFDDEGNDILEDTWFELTGIDEEEMNKFKFALGTWTQISRRNRKIRILSADAVNNVTYPITSDEAEGTVTEPKPTEHPPGFLNDLSPGEWAMSIENNLQDLLTWERGIFQEGYDFTSGPSDELGILEYENLRAALLGVSSGGPYFQDPFVEEVGAGVKGYEPRPNTRNANIKHISHIVTGAWTERYKRQPWVVYKWEKQKFYTFTKNKYTTYLRPNIVKYPEDNKIGAPSAGYQWVWQPSNSRITDTETGAKLFGEWIPGGSLVETQNQASSDNRYVGLVTKTAKENVNDIEQEDLFLYHEIGSDDYKEISAPLEIYFSLNYLERDDNFYRSLDVVKYQVIEWGDEDEQMSDQNILDSEFFYLYESDDSIFDGTKYKKLCLIASEAHEIYSSEVGDTDETLTRGKLHNHIYTEPGIKTIKTIVMRFDETETFLLETSIVHTNIFIADPNQTMQDFSIFGGESYTVLPLEKELEPIIGNVDKESEYVRSVEKIKNNDLYESSDYLEKLYADDFLPKVNQDLYGEYAGNMDLGLTRVFKKPYNIFDFIGGDALQIINNNFEYPQDSLPLNSSATEILINDGDCVVELNPSNQDNGQVENTGTSDERGVLLGDYRLVKNPNQKIRRDGSLSIAKLNTQKKRQAF